MHSRSSECTMNHWFYLLCGAAKEKIAGFTAQEIANTLNALANTLNALANTLNALANTLNALVKFGACSEIGSA